MNATQPIRVIIVDDHAMVRKGLVAFLKNMPELELVGEACNGREAIEFCEQRQPDVILMDLVMPELGAWRPPAPSTSAGRAYR
jgi:DNA-binding NarL/FixJ family response regulator